MHISWQFPVFCLQGGYKNSFCYNMASLAACNSVGKALDSWRSALCQRFWGFLAEGGLTGEKKESLSKTVLSFWDEWVKIRLKIKRVWVRDVKRCSYLGKSSGILQEAGALCVCRSDFIPDWKFEGARASMHTFPRDFVTWTRCWQQLLHPWACASQREMPRIIQNFGCEIMDTSSVSSGVPSKTSSKSFPSFFFPKNICISNAGLFSFFWIQLIQPNRIFK